MSLLLLAGLLIGGAGPSEIRAAPQRVVVPTGETIVLAGRSHRLAGVAAPLPSQHCRDRGGAIYDCGDRARETLRRLVERGRVVCTGPSESSTCRAGGKDLSAELVEAGWAVPRLSSRDRMIDRLSEGAKRRRVGLWQGAFVHPEKWRVDVRRRAPVRVD